MIGKVVGAFLGDKIAKQTSGMGGATGAALGVLATSVIRRMSLPAMIAVGAGGYLAKKYMDRQPTKGRSEAPAKTSTAPHKKPVQAA